jgi:hypothetical protein
VLDRLCSESLHSRRSELGFEMGVPEGLATALRWIGILLILFAIIDVVLGRIFGIDITGVPWSPLATGITGGILLKFFGDDDD